jgi:ABC-type sugar transport system substrate-binding protein
VASQRGLRTVVAAGGLALALVVSACGSGGPAGGGSGGGTGGETVNVDVGAGAPVKLKTGKLRVALFMNSQTNEWQINLAQAAKKQAESYGWAFTLFQANFSQQLMLNQLQNAATNKSFDAIAVVPIDGQSSCTMLTKTMPENNVVVTVGGTTVCGRDLNSGDEMWSPGTLSYNCVAPSHDYASLWLEKTAALFPGKQTAALVVGPEDNGNTILMHQLAKDFQAKHPDFQIRDFINTDFTTPKTQSAVTTYLQAHDDVTVLLSVYSPDISRGVVNAAKAAGRSGTVKIADMGGGQYSVQQINAGAVQLTMPYYPVTQGANMMKAIKDAQDGKPPVRIVDEIPGGLANAPVITKDNVSTYQPQY